MMSTSWTTKRAVFLQTTDYFDRVHLNQLGATTFSERLARIFGRGCVDDAESALKTSVETATPALPRRRPGQAQKRTRMSQLSSALCFSSAMPIFSKTRSMGSFSFNHSAVRPSRPGAWRCG